jgi:nickel transport protein
MKTILKYLVVIFVCFNLAAIPGTVCAQENQEASIQEVISLLQKQNNKLSVEIRRIHRELAALRADLNKPDVKDIFGGIGYILGLCGVAALVAARRKREQEQ